MTLGAFSLIFTYLLIADAQLARLCPSTTKELALKSGIQLVFDEGAVLQGLESDFDRKVARDSFKDFVAKLALRAKASASDESARKRVEERLQKEGIELLRQKVVQNIGSFQEAAKIKDPDARKNAIIALQRKIVREVLDQLPFNRVVWEEVAPYLKGFYESLSNAKKELFEEIVPALEMRIRNRLLKAGVPEERVTHLTSQYLQASVPHLANALAVEVGRVVNRADGEAVRGQTNRVVQLVIRKIQLMTDEWPSLAPQMLEARDRMGMSEQGAFNRVAPQIVESLRTQAWRRVDLSSKEKMDLVFQDLVQTTSEALPIFILSDGAVHGYPGAKSQRSAQTERLHTAVLGFMSAERVLGKERAFEILRALLPRERVNCFMGFSELVRLAKSKVTWAIGDKDVNGAEEERFVESLIPAYLKAVVELSSAIPGDRDFTKLLNTEVVRVVDEGVYQPRAEALSSEFSEFSKSLSEDQRALLTAHARRIEDFIEWRVDSLRAPRSSVTAAVLAELPRIFDQEIQAAANLDQDGRRQWPRILNRLRQDLPLLGPEVSRLSKEMAGFRESLSLRQRDLFDAAYPHLAHRHGRYAAGEGSLEKLFKDEMIKHLPSDDQIPDPNQATESFRWFARLWAMKVYNQKWGGDGLSPEEKIFRSVLGTFNEALTEAVSRETNQLVDQAASGTLIAPALAQPAKPEKKLLVDDAVVMADWKLYKEEGSVEAKNRLWVYYQPLVRLIAEKLKAGLPDDVDVNDLIAAGQKGLHDGLKKFDLARKVKFSSFASQRIQGSMVDYLRESMEWTRVLQEVSDIRERLIDDFTKANQRAPSSQELRELLQAEKEATGRTFDVEEVLSMPRLKADRLDAPARSQDPDSGAVRGDLIGDGNAESPLGNVEKSDFYSTLLRGFNRTDALIVRLYYESGLTMREVAAVIGISESRVSQMHDSIIQRLKAKFEGREEIFGLLPTRRSSDVPTEDEDQSAIRGSGLVDRPQP